MNNIIIIYIIQFIIFNFFTDLVLLLIIYTTAEKIQFKFNQKIYRVPKLECEN